MIDFLHDLLWQGREYAGVSHVIVACIVGVWLAYKLYASASMSKLDKAVSFALMVLPCCCLMQYAGTKPPTPPAPPPGPANAVVIPTKRVFDGGVWLLWPSGKFEYAGPARPRGLLP